MFLFKLFNSKYRPIQIPLKMTETCLYRYLITSLILNTLNAFVYVIHACNVICVQYAEDNGIPVVVSVGDTEVAAAEVNVRDTVSRQESKVAQAQLVQHLQSVLTQLK